MLAYFETALTWPELLKRTWKETQADNGLGLAAQLAYYFFLALFPALLMLIALASYIPADDLINRVISMLRGVAPKEVLDIVSDQLEKIGGSQQGGILTLGVLAALWSSSAALVAVIDALNRAYDVEDSRPWWKQRLTAVLLTLGIAVFTLLAFALVVAGPELADFVTRRVGLSEAFAWGWKIVQWPIAFALVATGIGLIYYFAPDVDQDFVWLTPGSVLAALLWLVGSLAFRFYVVNFGSYTESYGLVGGVMVLLLWLYLSGLVIIIGAEMNAEIEHASPHGKNAGEKVPGQRKVIGARAAREFRERKPSQPPGGVSIGVRPAATTQTATAFARIGAVVSGAIAAMLGRRVKE